MSQGADSSAGTADVGERLRYWREEWLVWDGAAYIGIPDGDLRARLNRFIKEEFDRINLQQLDEVKLKQAQGYLPPKAKPPRVRKVTRDLVSNTLQALAGMTLLSAGLEPPAWLSATAPLPAREVLAARNGLVHLAALVEGKPSLLPATPAYFGLNALDFGFDPDAPVPSQWLAFLDRLWPGDMQCIQTLQEWFGLSLLPDTRHQKMLFLVGPPRSGKGTLARVLTALVGAGNVAGPTLASLGSDFGLAPLLGKTVAIIPDARLSGRTDTAMLVERLLAITGEDTLTINRKHLTPVTTRLTARLVLLSNELPRLTDASRALASRIILLQLTQSWLGQEDQALTDKLLAELPGILLWAIAGWERLRARGRFVQPAASTELLTELEDLSSPISAFIRDCCLTGLGREEVIKDLYAAWKRWCMDKGDVHAGSEQVFCRNLRAAAPGLRVSQPRVNGRQVRVYQGIALLPDQGGLVGPP